jgi:hypothetical protein
MDWTDVGDGSYAAEAKKTHDPITGALVRSAMKILPTTGASLLFLISPQAD